jgi:hypothetical protein
MFALLAVSHPEALLARKGKGKEAKLCYSANALAENVAATYSVTFAPLSPES